MTRPDWFPHWEGQRAVIVGSGPSAPDQPLSAARGRCKVMAVNHSWKLCPWADALYASDVEWWRSKSGDGFVGLKISRGEHPGVRQVSLKRQKDGKWFDRIVFDEPGTIGAGASSGFQALNLAIQFGARRIALVGFDSRIDKGTHWHGDHVGRLNNPRQETVLTWKRNLEQAGPELIAREIEVVNCSPISSIGCFRKVGLAEWLET